MALEALSIIDVDTSQPFLSVVHAKQYDSVRKIEAHLFFSGVKWYVPSSNIYAIVSYKKSDRVGGFYDVTEDGLTAVVPSGTDRSIIYISLDRNMLTKSGQVRTEVIFFDIVTGGQLGSFAFIIEVEETSITSLDLSSSPYFALLAKQMQAVLKADSRVNKLQATAVKLKPNATPTANVVIVDEGTDDEAYNITLGIPSMPSVTTSAEKLAPNATPTATITGGSTAGQAYNIKLGIPSMPSITASAETAATATDPSVTVTGGSIAGQAYNFKFTLPRNGSLTPKSIAYRYALGTTDQDVPTTGWVSSVSALGDSSAFQGKYIWVENKITWTDNYVETIYIPSYNGLDGSSLHLSISEFSSFPQTINNSAIKEKMRVVNCVWGTPSAISGDVAWQTAAGSLTMSLTNGSMTGSTTAEIDLMLF